MHVLCQIVIVSHQRPKRKRAHARVHSFTAKFAPLRPLSAHGAHTKTASIRKLPSGNWRARQKPFTGRAALVVERLTPTSALQRRSEEHTSEPQSLMRISYAVFCLKKKNTNKNTQQTT